MIGSRKLVVGCATLLTAAAALACGGDAEDEEGPADTGGSVVNVTLREWGVEPDQDAVAAGRITFRARNEGGETHELVVLKTEQAPDALPVVEGKVDEDAAGAEIGEIEGLAPGGEDEATFELAAGAYVLLCNIVETEEDGELESHYEEGMRAAFTVR